MVLTVDGLETQKKPSRKMKTNKQSHESHINTGDTATSKIIVRAQSLGKSPFYWDFMPK